MEYVNMVVVPVAIAAASLTLTKGKIFVKPRRWIRLKSRWLGSLFSCPYCISHWFAIGYTLLRPSTGVLESLVQAFFLVGASAIVAGLVMKLFAFSPDEPDNNEIQQIVDDILNQLEENGADKG